MDTEKALQAAVRACELVEETKKKLDKAISDRAKAFVVAQQAGSSQQQIADATGLHVKTVQADLRAMRRTS